MEEEKKTLPTAPDRGEVIVRAVKKRMQISQPNSITWSRVNLTELQDNVVTCIIDQLQDVFNGQRKLDVDNLNQPYVTIDCDDAGGYNNKSKVLDAIKGVFDDHGKLVKQGLMQVMWQCRCTAPNGVSKLSSAGLLITTCHDLEGTNKVFVNINPWALPILLQGTLATKGTIDGRVVKGSTIFVKDISLSLAGKYTKRIYKLLCSWRNRPEKCYNYDLHTFIEDLGIPKTYKSNLIKSLILDKAEGEINNSESDITFKTKMVCRHPQPRRKKAYDTIVFTFETRNQEKTRKKAHSALWSDVDTIIWRAFGQPEDSSSAALTTSLEQAGLLEKAKNRFLWFYDMESKGLWTNLKVNNSIKKWVKDNLSEYNQYNPDKGAIQIREILKNIYGE